MRTTLPMASSRCRRQGGARSGFFFRKCSPGAHDSSAAFEKPHAGIFNARGSSIDTVSFVDHSVDERFVRKPSPARWSLVARSPDELLRAVRRLRSPVVEKWIDRAAT